MCFFQSDHSFILIFNEIEGAIFIKNFFVVDNVGKSLFLYTLLYTVRQGK